MKPLLGKDTSVTGIEGVAFLLETFHGSEKLGMPYRYELTLLSEDPNIDLDEVLGRRLTVKIDLSPRAPRFFSGCVTSFAKVGRTMRYRRYAVVLTPRLSFLSHTRNCRVFNDSSNFDADPETKPPTQNALDLVALVLNHHRVNVDANAVMKNADHVYRDRRSCVQYRESDLNFVQRLLEDEGIYYFFRHANDDHTMILADSLSAHDLVEGYESVRYLPREQKQIIEEEHFWSLTVAGSLYPGQYSVLRGYDHTAERPGHPTIVHQPTGRPQPGSSFEHYDYPTGLFEKDQAENEAQVRMQADQAAHSLIEVEGDTIGLGVGDLVKLRKPDLEDNPFWTEDAFEQKYLITSATYSMKINQYETGNTVDSDEPFKAKLTLLDSRMPFRPPRTATRPRIDGPQTAIVVGSSKDDETPSEDEIYTDKLGRVKVRFDWDREHMRNQKASCWVRVAQVWAGKQWGAVHLPRVGQEVVVEFLDGDPDRPLITGRVYNKDNMPPYELPKHQTQSGIKSRSSKGGTDQNFNEIRFEDLKGKEELHIQAERDMSTLVKHNQSTSVHANRSVTVGGNQSITVGGDETETYQAERKMTVAGQNTDVIVGNHLASYGGFRLMYVDGDDTLVIQKEGANKEIRVRHGMFTVGAAGGCHLYAGDEDVPETGLVLDQNDEQNQVFLSNGGEPSNKCELAFADGNAKIKASDSLTLECGAASITLKKDGTIELKGLQKVALNGGGSTVDLEKAGATMVGTLVKIN
jgi:type VI secretion system secreted protein VgrG